jgi:hypothetical protein
MGTRRRLHSALLPRRLASASGGLLALVLALGQASAQPKLGIGLYVPDLPFSSPAQRYTFAQGLAQHLTSSLGQPVEGRAYKSALDFERDVKDQKIHFAVVAGAYAAAKPGYKLLARAQLASAQDGVWSLLGKSKIKLSELQGKTLQVPSLGPLVLGWIQFGLLGGSVDLKKSLTVKQSPDLASAVSAVRLGQADLVVAPVSSKGLVPLLTGVAMPPPALVLVGKKVAPEIEAKVTSAVLSYGAAVASVQGWQAAKPGPYQAFAASTKKKLMTMKLMPVAAARLKVDEVVNLSRLELQMPAMEELFWVP